MARQYHPSVTVLNTNQLACVSQRGKTAENCSTANCLRGETDYKHLRMGILSQFFAHRQLQLGIYSLSHTTDEQLQTELVIK